MSDKGEMTRGFRVGLRMISVGVESPGQASLGSGGEPDPLKGLFAAVRLAWSGPAVVRRDRL